MMQLVADIGGTHARLALAQGDRVLQGTLHRYQNADFTGFPEVLEHFLASRNTPELGRAVLALAGPIEGPQVQLTNHPWTLDAHELAARLKVEDVHFLNDLSALGHALQHLGPDQTQCIYAPRPNPGPRRQKLVLAIGTGCNLCPVVTHGDQVQCLEAEFGHATLPGAVAALGTADMADFPARFATVEDCFSGRGFAAIGNPTLFARLMAALARDLVTTFLPRSGLYFAGAVARQVLQSPDCAAFLEGFTAPMPASDTLSVPVSLITDDAAALAGCAAY